MKLGRCRAVKFFLHNFSPEKYLLVILSQRGCWRLLPIFDSSFVVFRAEGEVNFRDSNFENFYRGIAQSNRGNR